MNIPPKPSSSLFTQKYPLLSKPVQYNELIESYQEIHYPLWLSLDMCSRIQLCCACKYTLEFKDLTPKKGCKTSQ